MVLVHTTIDLIVLLIELFPLRENRDQGQLWLDLKDRARNMGALLLLATCLADLFIIWRHTKRRK